MQKRALGVQGDAEGMSLSRLSIDGGIPHPNPLPEGEGTKTYPRKPGGRGGKEPGSMSCLKKTYPCQQAGRR